LDTASIISELEAERDRLDNAIAALRGGRTLRGRRAGAGNGRSRGPRHLSAEARKKIAESARKRWARAKAAGKNRL
jgi:hypothetical protein